MQLHHKATAVQNWVHWWLFSAPAKHLCLIHASFCRSLEHLELSSQVSAYSASAAQG